MREVKLQHFIDEISMGPFGSDIKVENFISEGVPVLNGSNLTHHKLVEKEFKYVSQEKANSLGKANAKRGDIVITHRGTLGQVSYIPENSLFDRYIISQSQFRVRFNENINPVYFSYLMKTPYGQGKLLSFKNHVGVPALAQATTNFKNLEMFIPDLKDQQKIAAVLSSLDDKIELNNKINAELEAMAKTLYDYWFVQFDFPISKEQATAIGNPKLEGKPYKTSGGKMVWNEVLKREIPEGWGVKSLYQIADFINGLACQRYRPENDTDDFLPVIKIREMNDGISSNTEKVRIDIPEKNKIDDGDILFSWSATLDIKIWTEGKGALNQHIFKVVSKDYPRSFYYFEILNYLHHFKMMAELRKTTMGHITIDHLKTSFIAIPSKELINELDKKLDVLFIKIISTKKQNQELASLRDWLLPMLMNGQVTVLDSEQIKSELKVAEEPKVTFDAKADKENDYLKRKQLALHILAKSRIDQQLGKVKFEKLLHLCEYHIVKENTNQQFHQHAAGPYDPAFTHRFFADAKKDRFASITKQGAMHKIEVSKTIDSHLQADLFSEEALQKMDELIQHFMGSNHEKPEVISTLYAVWNNRIIRNELVTDELLKADFLAWSEGKSRYESQLDRNLKWMRNNGIVPDGWGKVIGR